MYKLITHALFVTHILKYKKKCENINWLNSNNSTTYTKSD